MAARQFVKIHRPGENFWCEVLEPFGPNAMKCRVSNDVGCPLHPFRIGDVLIVKKDEVLDFISRDP